MANALVNSDPPMEKAIKAINVLLRYSIGLDDFTVNCYTETITTEVKKLREHCNNKATIYWQFTNEEDCSKFLGGNMYRVIKQVWV